MPNFMPRSAGEALLGRRLRVERRGGVEHYVPGQHEVTEAFEPDDDPPVAMLGYVDAFGHAVAVALILTETKGWQALAYRKVGYAGAFDTGSRVAPEGWQIPSEVEPELAKIAEESGWPPKS